MGGNLITYAITINNSLKMFQLIKHFPRVNSSFQTYISKSVKWSQVDVTFSKHPTFVSCFFLGYETVLSREWTENYIQNAAY